MSKTSLSCNSIEWVHFMVGLVENDGLSRNDVKTRMFQVSCELCNKFLSKLKKKKSLKRDFHLLKVLPPTMYDETSDPVGRFQTQQTCLRPVTIKSRRIWKDCLEMEIQDKSHDK